MKGNQGNDFRDARIFPEMEFIGCPSFLPWDPRVSPFFLPPSHSTRILMAMPLSHTEKYWLCWLFYYLLSSDPLKVLVKMEPKESIALIYVEDPWRRKWQHIPVFLPGKFHGQRSLADYSPWGCKELTWLSTELLSGTGEFGTQVVECQSLRIFLL